MRRVLVSAIATVNHRHACIARSELRCPLLGVAHDYDIRIAVKHPDGVGDGFALGDSRCVGVSEAEYLPS